MAEIFSGRFSKPAARGEMNTAHFVANQILDDVTQNGLDHTRRPITQVRSKFFKSKVSGAAAERVLREGRPGHYKQGTLLRFG